MTPLRFPTICLVTDRQRLVSATDNELVRVAECAAAAGVDLIQIRERNRDDRDLLAVARRIVALSSGRGATVLINDRMDVALAAAAGGVHLRADSIDADRLRAMTPPGFIIGRSVHGMAEALHAAASRVDYLIMGTVFPTRSKAGLGTVAGLARLEEVCRSVSIPVLAIGGITTENLPHVAAAGAAGIAAIGLFTDTCDEHRHRDPEAAFGSLVQAIRGVFAPFAARAGRPQR